MDTIFASLLCFLLAFSVAVTLNEEEYSTITPAITNSDFNTTSFTDMTTVTATSDESTSRFQTSQSTTISTLLTTGVSTMATTGNTNTPTSRATLTPTGHIFTTSETTVTGTANSSSLINTTSESLGRTTQGLRLNISEKNMTILFSVVLGVFILALVVFMIHKCKHKVQYLHQPLNNADDMADTFPADGDTLIISGGLYDGHPIYDNVPTPSTEQSQFRLDFLH